MNQLAFGQPPTSPNPSCAELMTMAEQELAAFFGAVTELFGAEYAEYSAQDWLYELEGSNSLPTSSREWRLITAKAMRQLARRVNASSPSTAARSLSECLVAIN